MESRPSNSAIKNSPILLSTSASTHLSVSSSSSQRRLRALSKADSDELPQHDKLKSAVIRRSPPSSPRSPELPLYNPEKPTTPKSFSLSYWLCLAYCSLAAIFFTLCLLSILLDFLRAQAPYRETRSISPINDFSFSYRMARLLQAEPRSTSFSPFISGAHSLSHDSAITACIWIEAEDIRRLETWSLNWDGPLSVVVVASNASRQTQKLAKEIEESPVLKSKADFHLIHRSHNETRTANSYLNLARLFARTRFVLLFPASTVSTVPDKFSERLSKQIVSWNMSQSEPPLILSSSKVKPDASNPFSPLSPVLLEKSHPIWCSERFFTAPSREEDWEECLWQFWLNSYGNLSTMAIPNWKLPSNKTDRKTVHKPGSPLPPEVVNLHCYSDFTAHLSCRDLYIVDLATVSDTSPAYLLPSGYEIDLQFQVR
ncbi:uncharacterized protein FOMMEDRAFT_156335 [Fomitiporia mediterranea MF3/22]|uniref:uncharacterized protein n=1 Tax=Fomitiporia mediterranea (strain MF3/22) TaxID=694068 RepID=UPI000440764F|nr:uncharacterized protein FOMMEDRAFT_156335 [Fomitiporia mediterranea MF3/22]EJD02971.1 hypothetical protein FOMMEDRAFT_156335 [Fomitiporia mediterranea MF3/22]